MTIEHPKCFMAYAGAPERIGEIMRQAAADINSSKAAAVQTWQNLQVGGNIIISEICSAVDESDIFICELTYLNANVLFELGYAIARKKIIWTLLDTSVESKKDFEELGLLSTVGYSEYRNTSDVVRRFFDEYLPCTKKPLYDQLLKFPVDGVTAAEQPLLYLKSLHNTDGSIRVTRRVSQSALPRVIDDPKEVRRQPFPWYAQNISPSFGVLCHLISSERQGHKVHNAKQALIAGIAYGLGKKLLMLAEAPYTSPIDYRDILHVAHTAADCEKIVDSWLKGVEDVYLRDSAARQAYRDRQKANISLQALSIGDPVAENEFASLIDYFVPTPTYTEALNAQQSIFIGRKGTGKSANLFKLSAELQKDRRNHVCVIKPAGYDLEGLVEVLKLHRTKAESGFLVESFWKFLVYSELLRSLNEELRSKPGFYSYTAEDEDLRNFCVDNDALINPDFSSRLDTLIQRLTQVSSGSSTENKVRISEVLHSTLIGPMRELLSRVLGRKERVMILIDNLDMAWQASPSEELGELLWGLLSVTQLVSQDVNRHRRKDEHIRLSVVLFLRSDIFYRLVEHVREKDKVSFSKLLWNDKEKLIRVIDERFKSSLESLSPDQVWEKYFVGQVHGTPTKEFILKVILPRPRDIIFFVKAAISEAVSRGHARVEESDFASAEIEYSSHALDSIFTEYVDGKFDLREVCYRLTGMNSIMTVKEFCATLKAAGIPEHEHASCLDLLRGLSFIGFEIDKEDFRFVYDFAEMKKLEVLSRRFRQECGVEERVSINRPFHGVLELA